jgi:hypothetical protein
MSDFGWKLLISSPLEDVAKPRYVPGSLSLNVSADVRAGQEVQVLTASWLLVEDVGMLQWGGVYVRIAGSIQGNSNGMYSLQVCSHYRTAYNNTLHTMISCDMMQDSIQGVLTS